MNNSTFIISLKAQNIGTITQRRYGVVNEDTKVLKRFFSPDINYGFQIYIKSGSEMIHRWKT
jgi:hypothetical protein